MITEHQPSNDNEPPMLGMAAIKNQGRKRKLEPDDFVGQQLWQMYISQQFTDVTIQCNDHMWKIHKVIIAGQSSVFAAMLSGRFLEGQTSTINLPEDDPVLIECMIQFLYTQRYGFDTNTEPPRQYKNVSWGAQSLSDHVRMYRLADKYDIPTLANASSRRYESRIYVEGIEPHELLPEFLESVPLVYSIPSSTSTAYQFRQLVIRFMQKEYRAMSKLAAVSTDFNILRTSTIENVPEFSAEMLEILMDLKVQYPLCNGCANEGQMKMNSCGCKLCWDIAYCIED